MIPLSTISGIMNQITHWFPPFLASFAVFLWWAEVGMGQNLVPLFCSHQNSWDLWMFIHPKNAINDGYNPVTHYRPTINSW